MKKNISFLLFAALIITVQFTLTGCNKKPEEVTVVPVDTTKTVTTVQVPPTAQGPVSQGQTPVDEKNKAINEKITTTTPTKTTKKERDIRNKRIGDDRHMRDTTTVRPPPVMPKTIEEKNRDNDKLKQDEAEAKRKEIERRRRLNQ